MKAYTSPDKNMQRMEMSAGRVALPSLLGQRATQAHQVARRGQAAVDPDRRHARLAVHLVSDLHPVLMRMGSSL